MRVVITGCNGFVGSLLYDSLHRDFELFGVDIPGEGSFPANKVFGWDELHLLPAANAYIHLAGKAHDTRNTAQENEYFAINLGLTQTIFDHFLTTNAQKFIFFSTVKAAADTVDGSVLTEEWPVTPGTPYGRSKLAAERYLLGIDPPDRQLYILRPCMIHGLGNKGNLNLLYRMVRHGVPWPLGKFINQRSFVASGNLVFTIRALLERPVAPGIYQVADDQPLSTNELITLIAGSMGRKPRIWNLSPQLIRTLAKLGDWLFLPLTSERLHKLTSNYVVSNQKLKTALEITHMPIDAREGMKVTLRGFVEKDT